MQPVAEDRAELRLRGTVPELVDLPWLDPLGDWSPAEVPFRDVPVGASRHLVRFVHAGGRLWALKELPTWAADREYAGLREMERRGLPAVRAAGLALRPGSDDAVLITEYLAGCWQYRRLLMRIPIEEAKHRQRLFDAVAWLVVDLHRRGVYWGDCSLANILFKRDGQVLQAYLVDAETATVQPALSAGQRRRLYDGPTSVVARWLAAGLDGWRIDVANMTGRHGDQDLTHDVARTLASTARATRPDAWVLAEHGHDAGADLVGDGWHGTMDYAGFTRPVWTWLSAGGTSAAASSASRSVRLPCGRRRWWPRCARCTRRCRGARSSRRRCTWTRTTWRGSAPLSAAADRAECRPRDESATWSASPCRPPCRAYPRSSPATRSG